MKTPKDEDFDSIVIFNSKILYSHDVMPCRWRIEGIERARIMRNRVGLVPVTWPGMKWTPSGCGHLLHLVIFDTLHLLNGSIEKDEFIAFLLHEIGHVVNPPHDTPERMMAPNPDDDEFYADDYARHCGLGSELEACLKKLQALDPVGFGDPAISRRINRIETGEPLLLNLSPLS